MPAIRDLPLAASLLLAGLALFFGGADGGGSLPWLGGGALLVLVVLIALYGVPSGWLALVPLLALTSWLALSRGGLAVAVLVVAAWLVLTDERRESAATLVAAAVPAAGVVAVAFALPGVTSDGQSSGTRWRDGLVFGAVLVAGAVAAALL